MNEILINIYNTVIPTATESIDWLTVCLTIIGLLIAYYGLLYNRPRLEIKPEFGKYDLKESLNYIKLSFNNVGTKTAFKISVNTANIEDENKKKEYFKYPEYYHDRDEIKKILKNIDDLSKYDEDYTPEELKEVENLNEQLNKIIPLKKIRKPSYFDEIDFKIHELDKYFNKIHYRELALDKCLNAKINILLPNETIIHHLTDYSFLETNDAEFNFDSIMIEVLYNDIRKMDAFGTILFFLCDILINIFYNFPKMIIKKPLKLLFSKTNNLYILTNKIKTIKNGFVSSKLNKKFNEIKHYSLIKQSTKKIQQFYSYISNIFKHINVFFQVEFNLKTMEIILKKRDIREINFRENIRKEDFFIQQKIERKSYKEYLENEFNKFLNSFKFQHWLSTLTNWEKTQMSKIILESSNIENYILEYDLLLEKKEKNNKLIERNNRFIEKYIYLLNLINQLDYIPEDIKDKTSHILFFKKINK